MNFYWNHTFESFWEHNASQVQNSLVIIGTLVSTRYFAFYKIRSYLEVHPKVIVE